MFASIFTTGVNSPHWPQPPNAVARIALVKPDKARGVENMILQMAQRGQITEKARDSPLKNAQMTQKQTRLPLNLPAAYLRGGAHCYVRYM